MSEVRVSAGAAAALDMQHIACSLSESACMTLNNCMNLTRWNSTGLYNLRPTPPHGDTFRPFRCWEAACERSARTSLCATDSLTSAVQPRTVLPRAVTELFFRMTVFSSGRSRSPAQEHVAFQQWP